jgi:hypothetical protein
MLGPGADGQSLTAALMQEMRDTMPPGLRQFPAAATRAFWETNTATSSRFRSRSRLRLMFQLASGHAAGFRWTPAAVPGAPIQRGTVQMYQQWIGSHRGDRPPWSIEDTALKKAMGLRHGAPPQERRRERAVP